jgi:hypothetical protein
LAHPGFNKWWITWQNLQIASPFCTIKTLLVVVVVIVLLLVLGTTRCFVHHPPDYSLFRPDYSLFHEKNTPTEPNRTKHPPAPFVARARSTPAPTNKACYRCFFCSLSIMKNCHTNRRNYSDRHHHRMQ